MRKIVFLLIIIILSAPGVLWAADPIIGTWKLKSADDPNIKDVTYIYREIEGNMIELTTSFIFKDGSSNSSKWIFPKEGGIGQRLDEKMPETVLNVSTLVEPGHWYGSIISNGKQVTLYHKLVSKDGKTLTQSISGLGIDFKPIKSVGVYEKQ